MFLLYLLFTHQCKSNRLIYARIAIEMVVVGVLIYCSPIHGRGIILFLFIRVIRSVALCFIYNDEPELFWIIMAILGIFILITLLWVGVIWLKGHLTYLAQNDPEEFKRWWGWIRTIYRFIR